MGVGLDCSRHEDMSAEVNHIICWFRGEVTNGCDHAIDDADVLLLMCHISMNGGRSLQQC